MQTANLQESPCYIVFDFLKREAGISYKDFATHLFRNDAKLGKVYLIDRLEDRSFLSRQIVRLAPGEMGKKMFDDFSQTSTYAFNELKEACGDNSGEDLSPEDEAEVAYEKLIDKAVPLMTNALKSFHLKAKSFMNVVITVANMPQLSTTSKGNLVMLLFIATGCTGDVSYAIDMTLEKMNNLGAAMRTATLEDVEDDEEDERVDNFGLTLFRIKNGMMVTPGFELYEGEEGNEIGMLPHGKHSIADVEKTVSRHHLKIWKADNGKWKVQGLNSKNGTVKIEAGTHNEVVVEHPRDFAFGAESPVLDIEPGDHLVLGQDTEFIVCRTLSS